MRLWRNPDLEFLTHPYLLDYYEKKLMLDQMNQSVHVALNPELDRAKLSGGELSMCERALYSNFVRWKLFRSHTLRVARYGRLTWHAWYFVARPIIGKAGTRRVAMLL